MTTEPKADSGKPEQNDVIEKPEQKKHALDLHADIGKTLITAGGVVLTITIAFLSIKGLPPSFSWRLYGMIFGSWVAILGSVLLAIMSNQRILSIGKKLAGTNFKKKKENNKKTVNEFWDNNISLATKYSNISQWLFLGGIVALVIAGLLFALTAEKEFSDVYAALEKHIESTKRLTSPISWESVSLDKSQELYTFILVDNTKRRLMCEITSSGNFKCCKPL